MFKSIGQPGEKLSEIKQFDKPVHTYSMLYKSLTRSPGRQYRCTFLSLLMGTWQRQNTSSSFKAQVNRTTPHTCPQVQVFGAFLHSQLRHVLQCYPLTLVHNYSLFNGDKYRPNMFVSKKKKTIAKRFKLYTLQIQSSIRISKLFLAMF